MPRPAPCPLAVPGAGGRSWSSWLDSKAVLQLTGARRCQSSLPRSCLSFACSGARLAHQWAVGSTRRAHGHVRCDTGADFNDRHLREVSIFTPTGDIAIHHAASSWCLHLPLGCPADYSGLRAVPGSRRKHTTAPATASTRLPAAGSAWGWISLPPPVWLAVVLVAMARSVLFIKLFESRGPWPDRCTRHPHPVIPEISSMRRRARPSRRRAPVLLLWWICNAAGGLQ